MIRSSVGRSDPPVAPTACPIAIRAGEISDMGASDTTTGSRPNGGSRSTSRDSRVFPTPAGPVSVTSRWLGSLRSALTSLTACSRPKIDASARECGPSAPVRP